MSIYHPLRIFAGSANKPLAQAVVCELNRQPGRPAQAWRQSAGQRTFHHLPSIRLGRSTTTRLPDSEIHVAIDEVVRDQDVFIIQPCAQSSQPCPEPGEPCERSVNDNLIELLLYVDAFRRASAHEITAVIPYYPYGRQERMAKGREAISAKVVATMLEAMGVSRVIYFDVHAPATQGFFKIPVDPLTALPVLSRYFAGPAFSRETAAVVSPDVGRAKFAGLYAEHLGLDLVVMHKRRESATQAKTTHVVGNIEGKIPIIIDDVIAGGSVLDQVKDLVEHGARPEAHLAITHGVLLPKALDRLRDSPYIQKLVITDTIYQPDEVRNDPKIAVLSVAEVLARVIWRIHVGASISGLIEKT
jgi:ribose-phosphate pyrophosphokinase